MRFIFDADSSMNKSLVEIYGGLTNLIMLISGSIIIVSICIYFLMKEFEKERFNVSKI